MEILDSLNEAQKQALLCTKGAVLVTAGAGSGKTKLLTHRIAYLIQHEHIDENKILAITFTNKAAREMKERVSNLLGTPNGVWVSTFHSMCLKILRKHITKLGSSYTSDFSIYSESDSEKTLKQVIKDLSLNLENYKHYANVISNCQNDNIDIYTYSKRYLIEQDDLINIYETYQKTLEKNNALDFDNLLTKTYELFVNHSDVLDYYANKFEYIFVDEFQDTNKIQYDIVKLLSKTHKNIFVVGDEDQCIYTWRGAKFRNIFDFKTDFAPVKIFKLEQNYRSTKNIIDKANKLIKNNTERFDKVLWTENDEGKKVECNEYYDEQQEAESVATKIIKFIELYGYKYSDIAILLRMNALTLPFEQKMLNYNIPYRVYGGFKFYERQEIKNLISYLRLFINPNDDTALLRIINFPKRAIGDVAINKLRDYSYSKNLSMLMGMVHLYNNSQDNGSLYAKIKEFVEVYQNLKDDYKNVRLDEFCKKVIEKFNIKTAYMEKSDENTDKLLNLDVFVNSVSEFVYNNPDATLNEFLESITLETDLDFMGIDDTITISTVHSVKGLEFKVVFVVGLEEGLFPISRAYDSNQEMEEERRLMYVAMTRAKERLFLSYASTRYLHGKRSPTIASRFIEEIGVNLPIKPKRYFENQYDYNNYGNNYKSTLCLNIKQQTSSTTTHYGYTTAMSINKEEKPKKDTSIYKKGQIVNHPKFGKGTILDIVDDGVCADIDFEKFGKKTLILEIAPLEIL